MIAKTYYLALAILAIVMTCIAFPGRSDNHWIIRQLVVYFAIGAIAAFCVEVQAWRQRRKAAMPPSPDIYELIDNKASRL